jgi:hypothetical protein
MISMSPMSIIEEKEYSSNGSDIKLKEFYFRLSILELNINISCLNQH